MMKIIILQPCELCGEEKKRLVECVFCDREVCEQCADWKKDRRDPQDGEWCCRECQRR